MNLQTVGGYRLGEKLGSGGMGVVYKGYDEHDRPVAVKVLHPSIADDEPSRLRLAREVRTLQRISHPRIAAVLDADLDAQRPYIVTEFVSGATLLEDVRSGGPFTEPELVHFGHALLDALEAVHAAGVVHRDLKPANVMISDGEPVVIDFGIAQAVDEVTVTVTGLVMGTPGYLSPEVVEGGDSSPSTDWWGWGATMAFAATGRNPFGGGGIDAVIARVATGRADLEDCPERFDPIIRAALQPKPEDRPTGDELLGALIDVEEGRMPDFGRGSEEKPDPGPGSEDQTRVQPEAVARTEVFPRQQPAAPQWKPPVHGSLEPAHRPYSPQPGAAHQTAVAPYQPHSPAPVVPHQGVSPIAQQQPYPNAGFGQPVPDKPVRGRFPTFGAVMLGMAAAVFAPLILVVVSYLWQVLARTFGKAHIIARRRRLYEGPGSGKWDFVSHAPGAFFSSVFLSVFATILPLMAGLATFILAHLNLVELGDGPMSVTFELFLASVVYTFVLWRGPGSQMLRLGTRLAFDRCTGSSRLAGLIIGVVLLIAAAFLLSGVLAGDSFDPWPLAPEAVDSIPQLT
ncbi:MULTISPECIES: serine/threonine-protein kinase [unclassified Brevibacterium]|uniref:serine/threonine-protein kinase n=1 Tax=unclassified Brevibacterium TaxID=2614124 RepID=UPI0008A591A8|nr:MULTISPECIES: serine/threonine-protein kinase [unclassified Brevibacterium]OFL68747.1 hypothetical protein HMPREF2757_07520 [Brevibacterium sp. HMSC063G07]OFS26087.1 hypothetical protein HMPREF3162_06990 [Brevibacterium sp. HMSC07C04]